MGRDIFNSNKAQAKAKPGATGDTPGTQVTLRGLEGLKASYSLAAGSGTTKPLRLGCAIVFVMGARNVLLLISVVGVAVAEFAAAPKAAELPPSPSLQKGTLNAGGMERTFVFHAPVALPHRAPLLIAFHGSGETGEAFRRRTGAEFDRLADANGFVVVYPDGYGRHWDDCRRAASYSARTQHIDDVAFVRTLIGYFQKALDVDPGQVFAVGHSNGAQMSIRLALELPNEIRAVAAISASLPTPENLDCQPTGQPVSVLVMNGTADLINPYNGGNVSIFGFGNRGTVLSSMDTSLYFASLDGISTAPATERVSDGDASRWVERSTWRGLSGVEVVLDTIHGGGHVVPQDSPTSHLLDRTSGGFDGPAEIWRFFARHTPTPPR